MALSLDPMVKQAASALLDLQSHDLSTSKLPKPRTCGKKKPSTYNDGCFVKPEKLADDVTSRKRLLCTEAPRPDHQGRQDNSKRRKLPKKRCSVRFESKTGTDPSKPTTTDDEVAVKTHVYDRVDDEEARHVWWSPDEIERIHKREKSMVCVLSSFCEHYVEQLSRIVEISSETKNVAKNETCHIWVADNQGRGLETEVAHVLGKAKNDAADVIQKILSLQQQVEEYKSDPKNRFHISDELQNQILCGQYQRLSWSSAKFAQLMAAGDAQVVRLEGEKPRILTYLQTSRAQLLHENIKS